MKTEHVTELEIEVTKKEIVKCDPGYRIAMEADKLGPKPKGTQFWNKHKDAWEDAYLPGEWLSCNHYAIPITPELIIHEGKRYEVVTDPGYVIKEGDLFWDAENGWKKATAAIGFTVADYLKYPLLGFKIARPLASESYEGEVVKEFDYDGDTLCQWIFVKGNNFKVGDRVKIEVIK